MITLLPQDKFCAEHWEELSAFRRMAFYPDAIGKANSLATFIQPQHKRSYKSVPFIPLPSAHEPDTQAPGMLVHSFGDKPNL